MAHSWSGNLVTNATWSDFWLNEGFTVYIERRILEEIYGPRRAEMEAALGYQDLQEELKSHASRGSDSAYRSQRAAIPTMASTDIPYEKGALFLRQIEQIFGRPKFDIYLKDYFNHFAFQSITTAQSLDYMRGHLFAADSSLAAKIPVEDWVFQPGLPASAPVPVSEAFRAVDDSRAAWMEGKGIDTAAWSTQEWMHFLRGLPLQLDAARMRKLDASFHLTESNNDEILDQWLLMAIRNRYAPAAPRLEEFLTTVGRRKYVKPLYDAMDLKQASAIYEKARPLYHPITQATIDALIAAKTGAAK